MLDEKVKSKTKVTSNWQAPYMNIFLRHLKRVLIIALVIYLSSCSSIDKQEAIAEHAVDLFHNRFNQEAYKEIYNLTGDELRKQASEQKLTELLITMRRKLGIVRQSTRLEWRVEYTPTGVKVGLNYRTEFAEGETIEHFVWDINGEKAILNGYYIDTQLKPQQVRN
jgi:hypothetical protein